MSSASALPALLLCLPHRRSPVLVSSVVLFDLLVNILGHNLAEPAYEAEVAQLEYKLVAGEHGLVIKVKGFNHKLHVSERLLSFQNKFKICRILVVKIVLCDDTLLHLCLSKLVTVCILTWPQAFAVKTFSVSWSIS